MVIEEGGTPAVVAVVVVEKVVVGEVLAARVGCPALAVGLRECFRASAGAEREEAAPEAVVLE